jgi:hypothetical protein
MEDLRGDRMPSHEGLGKARRAWDAYAKAVNRVAIPVMLPTVQKVSRHLAARCVGDMIGFWVLWHLQGGFEGLVRLGYDERTIYRKLKRFRQLMGKHPDEFKLTGVKLDPRAYWDEFAPNARAQA